MHRIEKFEEDVFIENGKLTRLVYGIWKEYKQPIYLEDEEGNHFIKNVDLVFMNGWMMSIPGEKVRFYGQTDIVRDEPWCEYSEPISWFATDGMDELLEQMKELCMQLYPDFAYVLKKWEPVTTCQLMEALIIWKEHPDVEFLLALNFENIAFSPAFLRLSKQKKKAYCKWIRENPDCYNICFKALQTIVCHKLTYQEWNAYQRFLNDADYSDRIHISYQIYKYLASQINKLPHNYTPYEIVREYEDYKNMAIRAGHNMKDDYWRYPQNLIKAHDKVMVEVARIIEAEKLAKQKAEAEEMRKKAMVLKALKRKFKDVPQLIDGYSIFISTDYEEWKRQAEELHQCICAGGYYQRMADGDFTIIFIQKDGIPQATAQVMPDGKINQFYGNELNRNDCKPSGPVREAFYKWLDLVPKKKFKKSKRKAA